MQLHSPNISEPLILARCHVQLIIIIKPLTEHLPAILANQSLFSLKAIYSRSQSSAEALASSGSSSPEASSSRPDVYYSVSSISSEHKKEGAKEGEGQGGEGISSDDKSLDALLSREDIKAVIVVLPILAQPGIIQKALSKGKHVLSEKPIAPDVDAGRGLISWYSSFSGVSGDGVEGGGGGGVERRKPLWAVAENFRFIPSLEYAAARLAEMGGELRTFRMEKWGLVRAGDKYFETECEFLFFFPFLSFLPFLPPSPPSCVSWGWNYRDAFMGHHGVLNLVSESVFGCWC